MRSGDVMKSILILVKNHNEDMEFARFITSNIREIFEDTIQIQTAYLDEIEEINFNLYDLILVMPHELISLYKILHDYYDKQKVIFPSRTFSNETLRKINAVPLGERVLVCNKTLYTTMETIRLLYQLGVTHIELVPYENGTKTEFFNYIITPDSSTSPDEQNTSVIFTGFRQLDCYAFIDIASHLNIGFERIYRNLMTYAKQLPSKHTDVDKWYLNAQMSQNLLTRIMDRTDFGVIATDNDWRVLYFNEKSRDILGIDLQRGEKLHDFMKPDMLGKISHSEFQDGLVQIGKEHVMIERKPLFADDWSMGYYFEFQTARNITNMGSKLSEKLHESGLYAKYTFNDIVHRSDKMLSCIEIARKLSITDYSVLITGESGVGKELFAQSIHNASSRAHGPFVAVNCAAVPEPLLESELFGYEGGTFTGAKKEGKPGLFELANKGSIFLDEIGDMPQNLQAKLLRVLQEKKIMRVGSGKVIAVDIRVISASNKNLKQEVSLNNFRSDLYYRLSTFTIEVPPLRERKEDVLPLFYSFLKKKQKCLTEKEQQALLHYSWPGNVRELQNAAAYYDVIGKLMEFSTSAGVQDEKKITLSILLPCKEAKEAILTVLRQYSDIGLGRHRILTVLRAQGIELSEWRFESIIQELVQEGVVSRGRGRAGIRII